MSRVAKVPIIIPTNINIKIDNQVIVIKGSLGELTRVIHEAINVQYITDRLFFAPREGYANGWALAGTMRALISNMVIGVTDGFTKKLQLVGVGYRAIVNDNVINLSLGFSHPINHQLPVGITAECTSQTEIVLKGADKQLVGQVAADLRAYCRPESYKGKGIRYNNEIIHTKEAKKKIR